MRKRVSVVDEDRVVAGVRTQNVRDIFCAHRDRDGIGRCRLVMQPKVIAVSPRPMRPFQGWRYLAEDAAPADLTKSSAASVAAMPEPMRRELRDLGLL